MFAFQFTVVVHNWIDPVCPLSFLFHFWDQSEILPRLACAWNWSFAKTSAISTNYKKKKLQLSSSKSLQSKLVYIDFFHNVNLDYFLQYGIWDNYQIGRSDLHQPCNSIQRLSDTAWWDQEFWPRPGPEPSPGPEICQDWNQVLSGTGAGTGTGIRSGTGTMTKNGMRTYINKKKT